MRRRAAVAGLAVGLAAGFGRAVPARAQGEGGGFGDLIDVRRHGARGDGRADDTAALNSAFAAAAEGQTVVLPAGRYRTTATVRAPAHCNIAMRGAIEYAGTAAEPALEIGAPGQPAARRRYAGLDVRRLRQSDWRDEGAVGIRHYNPHGCISYEVMLAMGFTIGCQILAAGSGVGLNIVHLGRLQNNRIGLDLRSGLAAGQTGYVNQNTFIGGWFNVAYAVNPAAGRYGVRFSAGPDGYRGHNNNLFLNPAFELGGAVAWRAGMAVPQGAYLRAPDGAVWRAETPGRAGRRPPAGPGRDADGGVTWAAYAPAGRDSIPVLMEVAANHNRFVALRNERNGPVLARHMQAGANANLYEVAFGWSDRDARIDERGRAVGSRVVTQYPLGPGAEPEEGDRQDPTRGGGVQPRRPGR